MSSETQRETLKQKRPGVRPMLVSIHAAVALNGAIGRDGGLPWRLSEVMIGRSHFRAIAEHTMHDRGVRTNPRPIRSADDIIEILELCA